MQEISEELLAVGGEVPDKHPRYEGFTGVRDVRSFQVGVLRQFLLIQGGLTEVI